MDGKVIAGEEDILATSDFVVGLRAHDFHEGLRYIVDSRAKDAFFNNTVLIEKERRHPRVHWRCFQY
jgi:hypothetical protein